MSTKKKENDVPEMILEKKEKKPSDIQIRMETGKVEIMKVVEGIPGAEKLAELIERGKKKGKLSSSELLDVLEDMELGAEQMDKSTTRWRIWALRRWERTICPTWPTRWSPPPRRWRRSPRRRS